ncbi:MAG: GWxTD domain-containing protein [Balneolaceae bacterium]
MISKITYHIPRAVLIAFLAVIGFGCATTSNPDVNRGGEFEFRDGYPEVSMSAIGLLNEQDEAIINITSEIVQGSLVYRTDEDGKTFGLINIEVRINQTDGSFTKTFNETFEISSTNNTRLYQSPDKFTHIRDFEVEPGSYEIDVTVADASSGKAVNLNTTAQIPDPENPFVNLTSILLQSKSLEEPGAQFIPVTTYSIPMAEDSLKFTFQVTNNDLDDPLTINAQLIHFTADTTYARPMHFNNYSVSSIQYRGIDMRSPDLVDENVRRLDQPGSVLIEFKYHTKDLQQGNYRFEVEMVDGDGNELFKARDFAILQENFPNVLTPKEMAEPLIYLMDEREYKEMMAIEDTDKLKEAVDRFWLSNVGGEQRARGVIELYYQRVEEANKQFTNFKEGWKTDLGMIYILFGPPWYIDRSLNRMQWSYSYDRRDPRTNFFFERNRNFNQYYPFHHYILQRNNNYFNIMYQQSQLWRTGGILTRRL